MVMITQGKQIIIFISIVVLQKENLARIKTDGKSLKKMKINLYWGYLKILTKH